MFFRVRSHFLGGRLPPTPHFNVGAARGQTRGALDRKKFCQLRPTKQDNIDMGGRGVDALSDKLLQGAGGKLKDQIWIRTGKISSVTSYALIQNMTRLIWDPNGGPVGAPMGAPLGPRWGPHSPPQRGPTAPMGAPSGVPAGGGTGGPNGGPIGAPMGASLGSQYGPPAGAPNGACQFEDNYTTTIRQLYDNYTTTIRQPYTTTIRQLCFAEDFPNRLN